MQPPLTEELPTSHWGREFETGRSLHTQVHQNLFKRMVQDYGVDKITIWHHENRDVLLFNITEDDLASLLSCNTCIELGLVTISDCNGTIVPNSYGLDSTPRVANQQELLIFYRNTGMFLKALGTSQASIT